MKIVFLCGCLEPGRDGVGDYSRRLGIELIRQGHDVSLLALHDYDVLQETNELQELNGTTISVLRIPNHVPDRMRFLMAKTFIDFKDPEWISLQYVPFAYQIKGLPFNLASKLKMLGGDKKWHIMFHELWVGAEKTNSLKINILSHLQRFIIRRMLAILSPTVIHTHLPFYQEELMEIGAEALDLALFSNIGRIKKTKNTNSSDVLRVCFFSQVGASKEIIMFLEKLREMANNNKRKFEILLLGGAPARMNSFKDEVALLLGSGTIINYTGFLPPDEISNHLQQCSIGITTIPLHGLGKSGTVAAFISHCVPVAAPNIDYSYSPNYKPFFHQVLQSSVLMSADYHSYNSAKEAASVAEKTIQVSLVAEKFVSDLN
jgi:hypothetical protein